MSVRVSVIIPTYNRSPLLRCCLDAVLAQRDAPAFEVLVVDDGSTDDTAEIVGRYDEVRLITQVNSGPAAARNHGVELARGEIVVFTDDDCVPQRDWLRQMVAPFDRSEVAGSKGAYLTQQRELIARFVQLEHEEKYDQLRRHQHIDFVDTYSAAFRRDVFLEIGGYDTAFPTASVEDQDLSFRLANAGHKMVFVPQAQVWHQHVDTLSAYCRKKYKIGFWKVLVLTKNPNKIGGDSRTPTTLKLQIALTALIPPLLLISGLLPPLAPALLALLLGFLVTTLPLTLRCARLDPPVATLAPLYIACRAGGLTLGLTRATLHKLMRDARFRPNTRGQPLTRQGRQ